MSLYRCTTCGWVELLINPREPYPCQVYRGEYAAACGYEGGTVRGHMVRFRDSAAEAVYRLYGRDALWPWCVPPDAPGESLDDALEGQKY